MSDQQQNWPNVGLAANGAARPPACIQASENAGFRLRLTKPHRLIQNSQPGSTSRDSLGNPVHTPQKGVDVRVSKGMFKTALIVMDRFIKALEAQDLKVELSDDHRERGTFARAGHDRVRLHLCEKYKRVEHSPTSNELRDRERNSWKRIPKWDDLPTGKLVLEPGGVVDLSSDAAINQLISKAVADVIEGLGQVRTQREAAYAAQKRECERQRSIEEEKKGVATFYQSAEALRQYRALTEYIEEVRRFGRVPDGQRREGQTLEQWLRWAEARAQDIHPLGG